MATSGGAERIKTSKGPLTIKTVAHPLEHVEDLAARSAEAMAEEIIQQAAIPEYPRTDLGSQEQRPENVR